MLFQCLLDHTQHKLYFCLISLLRNNVSNSVYINLRHSYINYYFMGGWPGDRSEELMSRAHSPIFPSLHLRHSSFSNSSGALPTSQLILQPFRRFTYVTAHSPTLPLLHLRHSSFSIPSFASPTSKLVIAELILQPFRHFTYVTNHSPTLPFLYLRHSSFSNLPFASPTSQVLHLIHLASRTWEG